MGECFCEGVRAVHLAPQIAKRSLAGLPLSVAITLDEVIASRVVGAAEDDEGHVPLAITSPQARQALQTPQSLPLVPSRDESRGSLGRASLGCGVCSSDEQLAARLGNACWIQSRHLLTDTTGHSPPSGSGA